jgi:hypothetical protein
MAILALPLGCVQIADHGGDDAGIDTKDDTGRGEGRYFTIHQYETLRALTGVLIPEDQDPGAIKAGVPDYIDYLLGAFTVDPPRIFAAGPFSGRHGGEDGFKVFLPLSRVREIAWRTHIEGSQGIAEREFNGPVTGLQEIYATGLEDLDTTAQSDYGVYFKDLDLSQRSAVKNKADPDFISTVFQHCIEGMYSLPEYGGNKDMAGWKYIGYEGDRQPIGYNREQVEETDSTRTLSLTELQDAAEFIRLAFTRYESKIL